MSEQPDAPKSIYTVLATFIAAGEASPPQERLIWMVQAYDTARDIHPSSPERGAARLATTHYAAQAQLAVGREKQEQFVRDIMGGVPTIELATQIRDHYENAAAYVAEFEQLFHDSNIPQQLNDGGIKDKDARNFYTKLAVQHSVMNDELKDFTADLEGLIAFATSKP